MASSSFDPSRQLDLYFRVNRNGSKTFSFFNTDGSDATISNFQIIIKKNTWDIVNTIELSIGSGLTISNNDLIFDITASQSDIKPGDYFWELYLPDTGKTWLNGLAVFHNGEFDAVNSNSESIVITDDGDVVEITITDANSDDEIPLENFTTVLQFDHSKELETVTGGTRTFTLSSTGNLNGVVIQARINRPVLVSFPLAFEKINGSDNISTSNMNIIVFRYFTNYDGSGNDNVLYVIKNQTSV